MQCVLRHYYRTSLEGMVGGGRRKMENLIQKKSVPVRIQAKCFLNTSHVWQYTANPFNIVTMQYFSVSCTLMRKPKALCKTLSNTMDAMMHIGGHALLYKIFKGFRVDQSTNREE